MRKKTVSLVEEKKDYRELLKNHRTRRAGMAAGTFLLVCLAFFGIRYYHQHRSYSSHSVLSAVERKDTASTKYANFGGRILKYGRDGISCTTEKEKLIFSGAYTMREPILALGKKAGAVADFNGNQIYIFDQQKLLGQVTTKLPIKKIAVSEQGMTAVLLEDSDAIMLQVYSIEGELIGEGSFRLESTGYPMNLSISSDGTKIAVTFAQVDGSALNTCLAVYNFDSVGENYVDHLVYAETLEDMIAPEVHYFGKEKLILVGDGGMHCYKGKQIPELSKEIVFEEEAEGIFYGSDKVGIVFKQDASEKLLKIYDPDGNLEAKISFEMEYQDICLADEWAVVYSEQEIAMYLMDGKEFYHTTLDHPITKVFATESRNKYLWIYDHETQMVELK